MSDTLPTLTELVDLRGKRALVTGAIPPASLAVGTPARVVRQGIAWRRERSPGSPAHPSATA